MNFIIDAENEDYHGLEGADFLKKDNALFIYHENRTGLIPRLYSEILKRTEAEVFFCKNERGPAAIAAKINELFSAEKPSEVIYIGHRHFDSAPAFDTVMSAIYAGCMDGAGEMVSIEELEAEFSRKKSLYEISESLSLDFSAFLKVYAENHNDAKKLYQELTHEFGGEKGLLAYRRLKDSKLGPFRKNKREPDEPLIFSDAAQEEPEKATAQKKERRFWQDQNFTPLWQEKSIYEEDEDEFF
ncbi:MAG: hypothetical protein ACI4CS_07580 [Candidatus Weimeria sp.]